VTHPSRFDLGDGAELRRYTLDEAEALYALVDRERERLRRWMPWTDFTKDVDDQRAWLERVLNDETQMEGYGIFVDGELAGGAGLQIYPFNVTAEIGYWIAAAYEGRGLVTRVCRAFIGYAFGEGGLHRIVIRAATENARSRAIPERLGFTQEGVMREEERPSDVYLDLVVYGLLETEWRG
jgi:ribosomal-protein-serine acetyltransferase